MKDDLKSILTIIGTILAIGSGFTYYTVYVTNAMTPILTYDIMPSQGSWGGPSAQQINLANYGWFSATDYWVVIWPGPLSRCEFLTDAGTPVDCYSLNNQQMKPCGISDLEITIGTNFTWVRTRVMPSHCKLQFVMLTNITLPLAHMTVESRGNDPIKPLSQARLQIDQSNLIVGVWATVFFSACLIVLWAVYSKARKIWRKSEEAIRRPIPLIASVDHSPRKLTSVFVSFINGVIAVNASIVPIIGVTLIALAWLFLPFATAFSVTAGTVLALATFAVHNTRIKTKERHTMLINLRSAIASSTTDLRTYRTNLEFVQTCLSITNKWTAIVDRDGHANLLLPEYPNLVQVRSDGLVKLYFGSADRDDEILTYLKPYVVTQNSQPFVWHLQEEPETRHEPLSETALLMAAICYVTDAYSQMVSDRIIPPETMVGLRDNIRGTLQIKEAFRDRTGAIEPETSALFNAEGRYGTVSAAWPAGDTNAGFRGFAFVDKMPVGAVMIGSTGDLILAINATSLPDTMVGWDTIGIYIPPGFSIPSAEQITASIANARIEVREAPDSDPYGPGWMVIYVSSNFTSTRRTSHGANSCYVRIRATAPHIAGKYQFKLALLDSRSPRPYDVLEMVSVDNWPVILVKSEFSTGTITGTLRQGDHNPNRYNQPIEEAGMVEAVMTMLLDPYTGQPRRDLPTCNALAYFNSEANGQYKILGLAPGIYNIFASAAGFPTALIYTGLTILKGQSIQIDGHLQPGTSIRGTVRSKSGQNDTPWLEDADVMIELYDAPTMNHHPDPSANRVAWSGGPQVMRLREVGLHQERRVSAGTTSPFHFQFGLRDECGAPQDLDGMVPQTHATWVNGLGPGRYYVRAWVSGYTQSAPDGLTFQEYYVDMPPNQLGGEVQPRSPIDLRAVTR